MRQARWGAVLPGHAVRGGRRVDAGVLAEHLRRGLAAGPGGVFAACGTGEFHALAPEEHQEVVRTAVTVTGGQVPVFAGAGADGLLLMPPYLVQGPPAGLIAYTEAVAAATDLPVIVYQRANVRFDPSSAVAVAALPTVAGFKDGTGDLDLLGQIVVAVREAASASRCTPRRCSASRRRSRWPSTRRSPAVTTRPPAGCWRTSSIPWCGCATRPRATRSRSSRRASGCAGWTSGASGPR